MKKGLHLFALLGLCLALALQALPLQASPILGVLPGDALADSCRCVQADLRPHDYVEPLQGLFGREGIGSTEDSRGGGFEPSALSRGAVFPYHSARILALRYGHWAKPVARPAGIPASRAPPFIS